MTTNDQIIGKYVQFSPLKRYAFCKIVGEDWPFAFMRKLKNPRQISPRWAVEFCLSAKEIGLDLCTKHWDLYNFVTEHEIYKKNKNKARNLFHDILHKDYDTFESEVTDIHDENYRKAVLDEFKAGCERRVKAKATEEEHTRLRILKKEAHEKLMASKAKEENLVLGNNGTPTVNKKPEVKILRKAPGPVIVRKAISENLVDYVTKSRDNLSKVWRNPERAQNIVAPSPSRRGAASGPVIIRKKASN